MTLNTNLIGETYHDRMNSDTLDEGRQYLNRTSQNYDMRILADFSMILPASKLKISAEKCDISKEKKTLQYHYISDKSEHAYTFEQKKSELQNLSKFNRLTPKI